jgi:hypothetical protein
MKDKPYTKKHSRVAGLVDGLLVSVFRRVNRHIEWHRLPKWIGLGNLLALRVELRARNLHDTDGDLTQAKESRCPFSPGSRPLAARTASGTQNDLKYPGMGCKFSRFGRNMPRELTAPDLKNLLVPNPLVVSKELLARDIFVPATSLNLLAAAWIQFQVHDWFGHEQQEFRGDGERFDENTELKVPQAGDWPKADGMRLPKTKPDPDELSELDKKSPAYRNENPQWWDGSQVYGESDLETTGLRINRDDPAFDPKIAIDDPKNAPLCPSGHLYLDPKGFLPIDPDTGSTASGFTDNWWLGLEILHTLFAKEHNAICDYLKASKEGKDLTDEEIFDKARLVNCAIMAKIHTVEWTPGILGHPAIKPALDANWMGLLGHFFGEGLARQIAGFLSDGVIKDVLTGVPLSETDHHGAPFALTEEFTAVYRLHPLIPDDVRIVGYRTGVPHAKPYPMTEIAFTNARKPMTEGKASMEDVIYSFGIVSPGAITIHNYPKFLRELELPAPNKPKEKIERKEPAEGEELIQQTMDLAAVDILRDRERGVPRYNEFRKQLGKAPVTTWLELAGGHAPLAAKLQKVYNDDLDLVDTMVGMYCEPLPEGFGFSDTAFRVFILMASRRLKCDRFFTSDYRAEIYTAAGLEWIRKTGMKQVILRHYPALAPVFAGVQNPFAPWRKVAEA